MKKITLVIFMSLMSFLGYAQFPESFNTGIPATWHVMDNGTGTVKSWTGSAAFGPPHSGALHAMADREDLGLNNTSEDWLVTPQFTVPTNAQIRFWTKTTLAGDYGTLYQLRVSTTSQTDRSSFTTFKQWTEPDLEALAGGTYNVYAEAVQSLTAYAGQSVYIAFVKVHTQTGEGLQNPYWGDRWVIDDVNVIQQCTDPSAQTATQITPTSAVLGWTSTGPATSWDIEWMLSTDTPTGVPNVTGATNPKTLTGLTPATNYKYYVRSVCSTGATSNWVGPFAFKTIPYGQICTAPIDITTLPFTTSSNTNLYGNPVTGSPGASCGITGNYLTGNDVFYAFTPTFTGVVDITMTTTSANSGLFVYGSCANVGSICLAGVANTATTPRNIPFLSVTAGTTYYIVISSLSGTIPYNLTIQQVGCPPPNNLGASGISQTGATLTWGNPGGATAWEYVFQPQGGGLPPGAGTPVTTTSATVGSVTPLTPNTNYEFYVRVDCGGGTYSVWAGPFVFRTLCAAFTVPFTEGFNSTSTTQACWTVLNVDGDANSWNMDYATNPAEGNQVASILSSSVSNNDWLISPQITLNGNQRLKYRYRVEAAASVCTFEVRYSTNGTSPADLTNVLVAPATYNNTTYIEKTVNMTGVTGNVNIGWYVAPGTNGSRIYIDAVIVEDIPACPEPMALAVSNIGPSSATISWTPGGTETSWQVLVQPTGSPAPTLPTLGQQVNTAPPYNYTGLSGSTTYDVYVLANCGSNGPSVWIGPITFRTPQLPGTLPFSDTFEGNFDWDVVNGTQTNKWFAGTAVSNGGTRSMYISNNNGVANAYTMSPSSAASVVQAYRDLAIPAGATQVNVAFDWRCVGELVGTTYYDYFRVWAVPTTFVPTAGTQITAAADRINLSGNLNNGSAWARRNIILNVAQFAGQNMRLVFEWRNDTTSGTNPPAAIDNIDINVITCPAPTALTVTAVTQTTATLQWTAGANETQWEIVVQAPGSGQPTGSSTIIPAGSNPFTVTTALNPATNYEYYVRAVCTPGTDVSTWTGPFAFATTQYSVTVPYSEDFEGTYGWNVVNGTQANKWIVGNAVYYGGTKSLYITNDNGTSNAYTLTSATVAQAYKDIQVPTGINQLNVAFDWRAQGETTVDYFRVWAVPTTFVPTAGTQITAAADRINLSGSINQSAVWGRRNVVFNVGAFAGQTCRLVFEWVNNTTGGTQPPAAIDNVNVTVITCPAPTVPTVVSVTDSTATVQWTAGASETKWEVVVQPAGSGQPTGSSTIIQATTNPFTITGLSALTNYEYYVRAVCTPGTDVSTWTGPKTFITAQVPATIPYNEGFEGTSGFGVVNGAQTNKWVEGTAANNGGTRALYVSNDNGTTNAYTFTATSIVHAYRDIAIPATCAGTVNISFDWRLMGQAANDFLNVWVVPATFIPTAGTGITTAASGGIFISNQLNGGASFTNVSYQVDASRYAGGVMRVIFEWRNNNTTGTNPPAAVDNFKVEVPACPKPYNLAVVGAPTPSGATVTWTPGCSETAWEIIAQPSGSAAPTAATAGIPVTTPPPYTINGLQPYTAYDFYVRAVCTAGTEFSVWSTPKPFTTFIGNDECAGAYDVPVNSNDQCTQVKTGAFNGSTVSTVGGTTCGTVNAGDIWYKFTAANPSHTIDFKTFSVTSNPIQMTVYSGDCNGLTQIACSYNNSATLSGLQIGSTYFIRASINKSTTDTNVQFNVCVKTPVAPASGTSLSCMINTVNPSFEDDPIVAGTYPRWSDLTDNMVLGWRTTATDKHMEIWPDPNYEGHKAHTGKQFAELNATEASGLYQDFPTPVTTVFTYKYAHKGRSGTLNGGKDVCRLLAGPPGGPYVEIDRRESLNGPNAWTYDPNGKTYTVPAGQVVTRFIFEAVSAASGSATTGNFLDSIEFRADNSIVSASPLSLDCTSTNVTTVVGAGAGSWSAAPGNPATTVIADPYDNTTTISGFTVSGTYTYNWTTLYCTSSVDIVYNDNGNRLPTFTQVAPVCASSTMAALPTTSTEGITGTWAPALDNTTTTTYTFTPAAGQCAIPTTMTITVTPNATPTFAQPAAICAGETLAALPTTSNEGINGTWSPAVMDNTTTTTYTFTPDPAGPCAVPATVTVTVTPNVTPTFAPVAPICAGDALAALPTTSTEGITGSWLPAVMDNTQTTEYTFTPAAGQCAVANTMTITVNPNVTPTFAAVGPICAGDAVTALPTTSDEGVTGSWSPAVVDNTQTTLYTFTPDAGQCAVANTMTITVNPVVTPTFAAVAPICAGEPLSALPTTSTEGVTGTWQPALDNTTTTLYTFIPDAGQCAPQATMTITVNPSALPTFTPVAPICSGESLAALPTTSNEGITGSWSPALDNTTTTTYTFTPDASATCISVATMTIDVNENVTPTFNDVVEAICPGEALAPLPTTSTNGITGTWSPALNNMVTTEYTFTPNAGQCASQEKMIIKVTANCDIPRGISPNNDGANDELDLTEFGVNKLSIFNRYGVKVYNYGAGYTNQWHGQSDAGQELPDGTYYYVINMGTDVTKTGWIYINREQ